MRVADRVKSITRHVLSAYRRGPDFGDYPREILDLVIFHKIHFYMDENEALQSYRRLKANFVDWNEVRISSIPEIQQILGGSPDTLEAAIFIKDLLEFLHQQRHSVDLEFLADQNITEIRRFLKQIKGVDATTISMILRLRKEYPVLPVTAPMESTLVRLGVVRPGDSRDRKAKLLHGLVADHVAVPFHHFFLRHSREICPPEEARIQCSACGLRSSCDFYSRKVQPRRRPPRKKR